MSSRSAAADDAAHFANGSGLAGVAPARSRYTRAASHDNQLRVTDGIPRRFITMAGAGLLGVGLAAALVALHIRQSEVASLVGRQRLPMLDLTSLFDAGSGSVAVWFLSALMGLAALLSIVVYSVRQHRIDDYHGRYRIWLWLALVWLLLSLNTTAGLHRLLIATMTYWTGWSALAGGAVWWLIPVVLLAATLGLRLLAEIRECAVALTVVTAAYGCWAASIAMHLGLLAIADEPLATAAMGGAVIGGHVLLLTGLLFYARHVVLDAEGLLADRRRKRVRRETAAVESKDEKARRQAQGPVSGTDRTSQKPRTQSRQASPTPVPAAQPVLEPATAADSVGPMTHDGPRRTVTEWTDGSDGTDDEPHDEEDDGPLNGAPRLSKADRKRLRKQKQRERQRHAA